MAVVNAVLVVVVVSAVTMEVVVGTLAETDRPPTIYLIDPKRTATLGWYEPGKCTFKLIICKNICHYIFIKFENKEKLME